MLCKKLPGALLLALTLGCKDDAPHETAQPSDDSRGGEETGLDACEDPPGAAEVAFDAGCAYTPAPASQWSIAVEWSTDPDAGWAWSDGAQHTHVMVTPVVGQLTDDNGDGAVDEADVPDIAFTSFRSSDYGDVGYLRVVSGDGSGEHLSLREVRDADDFPYQIGGASGVAIGDLEGDGRPDIVTLTTGNRVLALEADGAVKWVSRQQVSDLYGYPSLFDMDGDGAAEVIVGEHVFDAAGALILTADSGGRDQAFAADLDGDGLLEHIGGRSVTGFSGSLRWRRSDLSEGFAAVVDWDGDGLGDVLNLWDGVLTGVDTDGLTLFQVNASEGQGAPCVGDLDGDGAPEAAFSGRSSLRAVDNDSSTLWTVSVTDLSSSGTPCVTWDFDGDGASEVVLADEAALFILDGRSGAVLFQASDHVSGTLREQPVIADVDGDGDAELVLANSDHNQAGWDGVVVLGEANHGWARARPTWNQAPYWGGHVHDDLSLPAAPTMPWALHNGFRTQQSPSEGPLAAPDLQVHVLAVCEDEAGGLEVWVAPENTGAVGVPAGVGVALYRADSGALLATQATPTPMAPGQRLAPMIFSLSGDALGGAGLVARVDDDGAGLGAHRECDEDNNEGASE